MKKIFLLLWLFATLTTEGQRVANDLYPNIKKDLERKLYLEKEGKRIYEYTKKTNLTLDKLIDAPKGMKTGLFFDFKLSELNGYLYFGFIPFEEAKHPQPVYFRSPQKIMGGRTSINIKYFLSGKYDMIAWEKTGRGAMGYRIVNTEGNIIYDGIVNFTYSPKKGFKVDKTVVEGPFINKLKDNSVTISFTTNKKFKASVEVNNRIFEDGKSTKIHEININNLEPDTKYDYKINCGNYHLNYHFRTAPKAGSRKPFTFAYASDSRAGSGTGERNLHGTNFYIMKKILALASSKNTAFMQFSGDLVNGYSYNKEEIELQYANWKRVTGMFAPYFPVYATMGNHEVIMNVFRDSISGKRYSIDKFSEKNGSSEEVFGKNFVMPENGPESEDGAYYDPNPKKINFPTYKENVFYYTYDNVALIVLNSNYLYAPSLAYNPDAGGNLHGYLLDNQMEWLKNTLDKFEQDENIDHIFISQHTPAFPNGGHVSDDMWYRGNNDKRPVIAGKAHKKGIVERRDEYLDLVINKSSKVVAILTGDEHNYNRMRISPKTDIYGENYKGKRLKISRKIYQINNGAAGAPYYAQEKAPWSASVEKFSTLNALVLFEVKGKEIFMRVINPDTLEPVDELQIKN